VTLSIWCNSYKSLVISTYIFTKLTHTVTDTCLLSVLLSRNAKMVNNTHIDIKSVNPYE